jgi:ABC-2 type transport system ATP-binding protein
VTVAELDHVSKSYGTNTALDDVSFTASEGSIVAVLGPNGAGKSTALSLVLGLRRPDGGNVSLFGRNPRRPQTRTWVGAATQEMGFPSTLRVVEIIEFARAHFPHPLATSVVLERFRLTRLAHRQAGGLSGGERRRLAVALAFAGSPRLAVLDEPTSGLDVESRRGLWDVTREFAAAGGAVLLTTHQLQEAEELASSIIVLHRGRVVARGTLEEIRQRTGLGRVRVPAQLLPEGVGDRVERNRDHITIYARDPAKVVRELVRVGARLDGLEVTPLPLEDALQALALEAEP